MRKTMKRGKKMITIILIAVAILALTVWGGIAFLGRSQSLSVKSIENPSEHLYLIHLTKPNNLTWKSGSFAKFTLPDMKENEQNNRWLTIASSTSDDEILILTHNSGSFYKQTLTSLPINSKVEISWIESHLSIEDNEEPIVCFASDVGISAIRPIIREWSGSRPVTLSHLDKGVTVFDKEMTELSTQKENFTYETSTSLSESQEQLAESIKQYGNKATYLLGGRPDDLDKMKKYLEEKGINSPQIKMDRFEGLK